MDIWELNDKNNKSKNSDPSWSTCHVQSPLDTLYAIIGFCHYLCLWMRRQAQEDPTCPRPPSWLVSGLNQRPVLICYTVLVSKNEAMGLGHFIPCPALLQLLPAQVGWEQPQGSQGYLPSLPSCSSAHLVEAQWLHCSRIPEPCKTLSPVPGKGNLSGKLCIIPLPSQVPVSALEGTGRLDSWAGLRSQSRQKSGSELGDHQEGLQQTQSKRKDEWGCLSCLEHILVFSPKQVLPFTGGSKAVRHMSVFCLGSHLNSTTYQQVM